MRSRAEGLANGELVDVSEAASHAGFSMPAALTREAWDVCVSWPDGTPGCAGQSEEGRLADVMFMAYLAHKQAIKHQRKRMEFFVERVPRVEDDATPVHLVWYDRSTADAAAETVMTDAEDTE